MLTLLMGVSAVTGNAFADFSYESDLNPGKTYGKGLNSDTWTFYGLNPGGYFTSACLKISASNVQTSPLSGLSRVNLSAATNGNGDVVTIGALSNGYTSFVSDGGTLNLDALNAAIGNGAISLNFNQLAGSETINSVSLTGNVAVAPLPPSLLLFGPPLIALAMLRR